MTKGLLFRLQANGGYSEHGFLLIHADTDDQPGIEDYWAPQGPGVWEGPGWVKVEGPSSSVTCNYDVQIFDAGNLDPDDEGPVLEVVDEEIVFQEPLDLRWWVPNGRYRVSADIVELGEDPELGPLQSWAIRLARE